MEQMNPIGTPGTYEEVQITQLDKNMLNEKAKLLTATSTELSELRSRLFPEKPGKKPLIKPEDLEVLINCQQHIRDIIQNPPASFTFGKQDKLNKLSQAIESYKDLHKHDDIYKVIFLKQRELEEAARAAVRLHTYTRVEVEDTRVEAAAVGKHPSETTAPSASPKTQNLSLSETPPKDPATKKKEEDIEYFTQCGKAWGIYIPEDSICSSEEEAKARKKENSSAKFFVWRTDNGSEGQCYYFLAKDQEKTTICKNPILLQACMMDWQKKATIKFFQSELGEHISPENVCDSEQDARTKLQQNPSLEFCVWLTREGNSPNYDLCYAKNCLEPTVQVADALFQVEEHIIRDKLNNETTLFNNEFFQKGTGINLDKQNISISKKHAEKIRNNPHLSFLVWKVRIPIYPIIDSDLSDQHADACR